MTWSALSYRGRTICYEVAGEQIKARELGQRELLLVDEDLRAAIAADVARQEQKRQEA